MSSRQLRKLQQQRDLEEATRRLQAEEDESDDESISSAPLKAKPAFSFAALNEDEDEDGNDEAAEKEESPNDLSDAEPERSPVAAPKAKKSKKKKKKAKGKAKVAEKAGSDSDGIESALRELNLKSPASGTSAHTTRDTASNEQWGRICALLAVQTQHLKVANEMRTLFGRAATDNHDDAGGRARGGRQRAQNQPMDLETALKKFPGKKGLPEITLRRNTFIQGKDDWPNGTTGGLSMELVDDVASDGTVEFKFVHNKAYQDLQQAFYQLVEMGDPQNLIGFLQKNPYHLSSLIQVSKIAKDQGDHALSSDLLERALFTFGRAGLSLFNAKITQGKARLDFHRPENRELWLAGYQYIKSLVMKGTYRTAFEWAKLLLNLDPEEDPYCMRLMIHHLALKAHQFSWLLEIGDLTLDKGDIPIYNKNSYATYHNTPSLAFAALQLRDQSKARDLLSVAMRRLPWVFVRLFQELNMDAPKTIWGTQPRTDSEDLFTSIYIQQAKNLWDTPEATALLMEIAHTIPIVDAQSIPVVANDVRTLDVVRYVYLDNTPALMSLVPNSMLHKSNNSDSDPIPPDENIFSYPAQKFALEGHGDHDYPGSNDPFMIPFAAIRNLMPNFLGRGPRGADDESDEDELDDDEREHIARLRQALEERAANGENVDAPPPGIARRLLQMIWNTSVLAAADEDDDDAESVETDSDDEMPGLMDHNGVINYDEVDSDSDMPGLEEVNAAFEEPLDVLTDDEEMPDLI